jgi:fumarate reductase subunit D
LNFNIWPILVIVVLAAIDFGLIYHHDYSELEVVGGISNHVCMLVEDLVAFLESQLGYFRFCNTLNFNIWSILVLIVHAAIDFGLLYYDDYSELEVVGGISNHLCMLDNDLVAFPESH